MQLDFSNPAHLKIHLLSQGIRLSPNFFKFFSDEYQGSPYHYSKDNTFAHHYPHHMTLKLNTNCAINLDEDSPWCLEADKDNFFITHNDKKITDITFKRQLRCT